MKRRTKWIIAGAATIIIVGSLAAAAASRNGSERSVRIEPIKRRDLVSVVTASGWVRPHTKIDVQSDIMGRVVALNVKEGDRVKKGEILLRIDPAQYEATVTRSQAAVSQALASQSQAQANVYGAQAKYDRARNLAKSNAALISPQDLEDAETQLKVQQAMLQAAQYSVDQARAALRGSQDELSKTVIRAPIDGVVTRLNIHQGETAIVGTMNNPGSLLLTVSDLDTMEAVVQVDETDVPSIKLGDSASVEIDAFPREKFTGVVTEIGHSAIRSPEDAAKQLSASSTTQATDFEVVVRLEHPPRTLRPDLSATADVVTARRKQALAVPIIALTVRQRTAQDTTIPMENKQAQAAQRSSLNETDQEGVFVLRDGKAHFVPVTVGIAGQEYFEVLSGLTQGDSVVAGPYDAIRALQEGNPIRALAQPAPTEAKQGGNP